jgi:hypothetical protein
LAGGSDPTGTITFALSLGGKVIYTSAQAVAGNGTYGASYRLPTAGAVAGLYTWTAGYGGDSGNLPASDGGGAAEQTWVYLATPTIATVASPSVVKLNPQCPRSKPVTIYDTATLSGGYFPSGKIVFTLTDPKGRVISTQSLPVSGNGAYKVGYTIPAKGLKGTYKWSAVYAGDGNNRSVRDNGVRESTQATKTGKPPLSAAYLAAYRPLCPKSPFFGKFHLPLPRPAHSVVNQPVNRKVVIHR